jgi:hypothetical protein
MLTINLVLMKKTLALTIILMLLALMSAGALFVNPATANFIIPIYPHRPPPTPVVTMQSTQYDPKYPYVFTLTFRAHVNPWIDDRPDYVFTPSRSIQVWLDGKVSAEPEWTSDSALVSVTLKGFGDGAHDVEVIAMVTGTWNEVQTSVLTASSGKIYFNVDTIPPTVSFLSANHETFNSTNFQFDFAVSESASWIGISLDGEYKGDIHCLANSALTFYSARNCYNMTLTGLSGGSHTLTVYAKDAARNMGASKPFDFSVVTPEFQPQQTVSPTPTPSPSPSASPSSTPSPISTFSPIPFSSLSPNPSRQPSASPKPPPMSSAFSWLVAVAVSLALACGGLRFCRILQRRKSQQG